MRCKFKKICNKKKDRLSDLFEFFYDDIIKDHSQVLHLP